MFFDPSAYRKMLNVKVIDDEEYEKNKTFLVVLEEPILLEVGQRHGELRTQQNATATAAERFSSLFYGWNKSDFASPCHLYLI